MLGVVTDEQARAELATDLDELVGEGARRLLAAALEAEVDAYLAAHIELVDERGQRVVVRNGYAPARKLTTAASQVVAVTADTWPHWCAPGPALSGASWWSEPSQTTSSRRPHDGPSQPGEQPPSAADDACRLDRAHQRQRLAGRRHPARLVRPRNPPTPPATWI
jgi:hypothetical protein